jgi:hypothetical protein
MDGQARRGVDDATSRSADLDPGGELPEQSRPHAVDVIEFVHRSEPPASLALVDDPRGEGPTDPGNAFKIGDRCRVDVELPTKEPGATAEVDTAAVAHDDVSCSARGRTRRGNGLRERNARESTESGDGTEQQDEGTCPLEPHVVSSPSAWHVSRMSPSPRVVVAALVFLVPWVVLSSSCRRACQTSENCRRSCDCLNTATDTRNECSLAFVCEGAEGLCEEAYDTMSCDEMCADYHANALCGVARCRSDADCTRRVECDVLGPSGAPTGQKRGCEVLFACDIEASACDVGSLASEAELCVLRCSGAPVGG